MSENYFRELESYKRKDILECLGNDKESFNKLRINNIINKIGNNYNFHYVGSIVLNKHVLNVYPKYIPDKANIKNDFKQILKVFNKYNKLYGDVDSDDDLEDASLNILPLMIFFIEDYYENGAYYKVKNVLETNGNGEINWNKTINDTFPIINNNKPFYTELQTNHKINNLFNYFRLLHEFIITESSKVLQDSGLLEMLDLTPVALSDRVLDDFGDIDYILNRLKLELNVEFNTHRQKLLKSMYSYLSQMNSFSNDDVLLLYGTTDYEYVWEDVCSKVFDNKLSTELSELDLGLNSDGTLMEYINKPEWILDGNHYQKRTLRPDLITIIDDNFIIFDAKYYHFSIENNALKNQPDLDSITKQYLYELAYKWIIGQNRLKVINGFLFPTYEDDFKKRGHVELDIWFDLELQDINVIMVPAKKVYQHYLDNEIIPIKELLEILYKTLTNLD